MSKVRVPLHGKPQGYATVDTEATPGAVVGVNLRWRTGEPVSEQALVAALQGGGVQTGGGTVYWRTIMEIPPNVTALAEQAGTGLYVLDDAGSSVTRTLAVEPGELTLTNGDGVGGNPTLGLPTISPDPGGALKRYGFDTKGRRTHEEPADTDDLEEGDTNRYFSDERAQDATGAILDDSGDVELHFEDAPARRIWAELSAGVLASLAAADGAVQADAPVLDPLPPDAPDDTAAAAAGVPVGGLYRDGSVLMIRVV